MDKYGYEVLPQLPKDTAGLTVEASQMCDASLDGSYPHRVLSKEQDELMSEVIDKNKDVSFAKVL